LRDYWNDVWLEGRGGDKISYEKKADGGKAVYFYGIPCGVDFKAVLRKKNQHQYESEFINLEQGKSMAIRLEK